jgi:hypothetical protein
MVQVGSQYYIKMFFFPFLIAKLWLNWIMDDCHFGYITKLVLKKKEKKRENTA